MPMAYYKLNSPRTLSKRTTIFIIYVIQMGFASFHTYECVQTREIQLLTSHDKT